MWGGWKHKRKLIGRGWNKQGGGRKMLSNLR